MEVTQKIEHLIEKKIDEWTETQTDDSEPFPLFRTLSTEENCSFGITVKTQDIGMLDGHEGTCCNVRKVILLVGLFLNKDLDTPERDIAFSKKARLLRKFVYENLKTTLNTFDLDNRTDTEMTLYHAEPLQIGEDIDVDVEGDFVWKSSGSWELTVSGEELDFGI